MRAPFPLWIASSYFVAICCGLVVLQPICSAPQAEEIPPTAAQARQVLDLAQLPLMKTTISCSSRNVARLRLRVSSSIEDVFEFYEQQLVKLNWKPDGLFLYNYGDGVEKPPTLKGRRFNRNGYHLNLIVKSNEKGSTEVEVVNHGRLGLARLPVPREATRQLSHDTRANFHMPVSRAVTVGKVDSALRAGGWQTLGTGGDELYFRKNAIKLHVLVSRDGDREGQSYFSFEAFLMPADLPIPEAATDLAYSNETSRLSFRIGRKPADVLTYYFDCPKFFFVLN